MNSKTIWGDHQTSRWEFQPKDNKNNNSKTLADSLIPAKEIKKPEPDSVVAQSTDVKLVQDEFDFTEANVADKLAIVISAVRDYIDREITTPELEEILALIES